MSELLPVMAVLALGVVITFSVVVVMPLSRREQAGVTLSFLGHVASAFAMVWVTTALGGGDMFAYHRIAQTLTPYLRLDFGLVGPEVLALLFQRPDAGLAGVGVRHGLVDRQHDRTDHADLLRC